MARVVDAAFTLFAARGYDEVTVAEICAAAEIAPRTFFRYFPTKDDLLAEPARVMAGQMRDALRRVPPEVSDVEALRRALLEVGSAVLADRERTAQRFRVVRSAATARSHPSLRLTDRERELAGVLAGRRGGTDGGWRTRLLVARSTAAFRIWLDDLVDAPPPEALTHLREVLDEP